jgi:hypothetical protein
MLIFIIWLATFSVVRGSAIALWDSPTCTHGGFRGQVLWAAEDNDCVQVQMQLGGTPFAMQSLAGYGVACSFTGWSGSSCGLGKKLHTIDYTSTPSCKCLGQNDPISWIQINCAGQGDYKRQDRLSDMLGGIFGKYVLSNTTLSKRQPNICDNFDALVGVGMLVSGIDDGIVGASPIEIDMLDEEFGNINLSGYTDDQLNTMAIALWSQVASNLRTGTTVNDPGENFEFGATRVLAGRTVQITLEDRISLDSIPEFESYINNIDTGNWIWMIVGLLTLMRETGVIDGTYHLLGNVVDEVETIAYLEVEVFTG